MSQPCCNWWCSIWCIDIRGRCLGCVYDTDCVTCGGHRTNDEHFTPGVCQYPATTNKAGGGTWGDEFEPSEFDSTASCSDDGGGDPLPMGLLSTKRKPHVPLAKTRGDVLKWFVCYDPAAAPLRDLMKTSGFREAFHAHIKGYEPEAACATGTHFMSFIRDSADASTFRDVLCETATAAAFAVFTAEQAKRRHVKGLKAL